MVVGQHKYTPRTGYWLMLLALLAGLAGTGVAVVHTTFVSRQLLNVWQGLEQQGNQLQVEWRRLLLEQGSLVSQGKVEEVALSQLGMEVPDMEKTIVLKSD